MNNMHENTKLKKLLEYAEKLSKKGDSDLTSDACPLSLQYYKDNSILIMEQDLKDQEFNSECSICIRRDDLAEPVRKQLHSLCCKGTNETLILGVGLMRYGYKNINHPLILFEMTCLMLDDYFLISPVADMDIELWNFEVLCHSLQEFDKLKKESAKRLEDIKNLHPNSDDLYDLMTSLGMQLRSDFSSVKPVVEDQKYYLNNQNLPKNLEILRTWVIYKPSNSKDANTFSKLLDSPSCVIPSYCKDIIDGPSQSSSIASHDHPAFLLPLPYNADQLKVVKLLCNSNVVVVEGPPGTGKTHTIANIACHLISQGNKILITSHGIHALSVMKKKIGEAVPWLANIAISWEGSKRDMLDQLVEATKRLNDVQNMPIDHFEIERQKENLVNITQKLHNVECDDEFLHSIFYQSFEHISKGGIHISELCNKSYVERIREFASFLQAFMKKSDDLSAYKNFSPEQLSSSYILPRDRSYLHLDADELLPFPNPSLLALMEEKDLVEKVRKELQTESNPDSLFSRISRKLFSFSGPGIVSMKVQLQKAGLTKWLNSIDPIEIHLFNRHELIMNCFSIYLRQYLQLCKDVVGIDLFQKNLTKREQCIKDICKVSQKLVAHMAQRHLQQNLKNSIFSQLETLRRLIKDVAKIETKSRGKRMPAKYYRARKELEQLLSNSALINVLPLWIMPTANVSELLPAEFGVFDVVILDEASQSDFSSFPALLRGKKIIVIGDDQQVAPARAIEKDQNDARETLEMFPDSTVENVLPGCPLFSLFKEIFSGSRVLLREHFRCLPEIIKFSNAEFYQNALIPLRRNELADSDAFLKPLERYHVQDGECRVQGQKRLNFEEQDCIVEKIREIVHHYDRNPIKANGKPSTKPSIGVLSLWNIHQAEEIKKKLTSDPFLQGKIEEYNMEFGDAATFQGSEKDIIMLTMVAGPRNLAAEQERHEQSFNVAVSRAKNCLMLFHSVSPADLKKETDMRLKLLNFFNSSDLHEKDEECAGSDHFPIPPAFSTILNKLKSPDISADLWSIGSTVGSEDIRVIELSSPGCSRVAVFLHNENETPSALKEKYACSCMMVRVGWSVCHVWESVSKLHEEEMVSRIKKFWEQVNAGKLKRKRDSGESNGDKRPRQQLEPQGRQEEERSSLAQSLQTEFSRDFYASQLHSNFRLLDDQHLLSGSRIEDDEVIVIDED